MKCYVSLHGHAFRVVLLAGAYRSECKIAAMRPIVSRSLADMERSKYLVFHTISAHFDWRQKYAVPFVWWVGTLPTSIRAGDIQLLSTRQYSQPLFRARSVRMALLDHYQADHSPVMRHPAPDLTRFFFCFLKPERIRSSHIFLSQNVRSRATPLPTIS